MTRTKKYIYILLLGALLLSGCVLEQTGYIQLSNESGATVERVDVTVQTANGDVKLQVPDLMDGHGRKFQVDIADAGWGIGGSTYAALFSVSYEMNGAFFDVRNDVDAVPDAVGSYYNNNAGLCEGETKTIAFLPEGYKIR